jgi:hypothetical protein
VPVALRRLLGVENFAFDLGCRPRGVALRLLLLAPFGAVGLAHDLAGLGDAHQLPRVDAAQARF